MAWASSAVHARLPSTRHWMAQHPSTNDMSETNAAATRQPLSMNKREAGDTQRLEPRACRFRDGLTLARSRVSSTPMMRVLRTPEGSISMVSPASRDAA